MTSIKMLSESSALKALPSSFAYSVTHDEPTAVDPQDSIPVLDFSLYTSGNPDERAKFIRDLNHASEEWGGFMLVNHGISEDLIKKVMDAATGFFKLPDEERKEFQGKEPLAPIKCGPSFHNGIEGGGIFLWRDYLKVVAHPEFNFPYKPAGFSELALEYSNQSRELTKELLKAVCEALGVEESYVFKTLNLDKNLQILAMNLYPPCPQPEIAIGLPPHTDHGLLTLLAQNGVGGLQAKHNAKWYNMEFIPNGFLVNIGDQLEILTNGRYKSLWHRAVVNNTATRMTLVTANGPSLETAVVPAPEFVNENKPAAYLPLGYKEYVERQQLTPLGRSCLETIQIV